MPSNDARIGWARKAADAYCKATRHRNLFEYISDPSDGEEVIADLLCDLRHLADSMHVDWDQAGTMAATHYSAELKDKDHLLGRRAVVSHVRIFPSRLPVRPLPRLPAK